MIKASADALLDIINDILDFSKIEAGKLDLEAIDFPLRDRLGDTMRALALRAHKKGLELACHIAPDAPDALVGDPGRLGQVIVNLVGNAIKFTEQGEVVVRVRLAEEEKSLAKAQGSQEDKKAQEGGAPSCASPSLSSSLGALASWREVPLHLE